MKILPTNLNNNYKINNQAKSNINLTKTIANDSVNFTSKVQKHNSTNEELYYSTALTVGKRAKRTMFESKQILKTGKHLFQEALKIKAQSDEILKDAKARVEEFNSFGQDEIYTQNKQGKRTGLYRIMGNGNYYIEKTLDNQATEQIMLSADKKSGMIVKINPNNPDKKDIWEFKDNKLTRFEQNQTGIFSIYSRKIFTFNDSKSTIETWRKIDNTPIGKYHYDENQNITKYTQYIHKKEFHKDFNFRNNELKNYHDGSDNNEAYEEAFYDNEGKCYEAIIYGPDNIKTINKNIKTKYTYDGDNNPAYITRYTEPKELYICLVGHAFRAE